MTITTYTDREIALQKRVAELEKELSDTDIALEECKMDWSGDVTQIKAEHKHELALEKQLAQLNGEIASDLKADKLRLEAALDECRTSNSITSKAFDFLERERDEYQQAADKMAMEHKVERDTLRQQLAETMKDALRYRWLRNNSASISWNPSRFNAEIVSGFAHDGTGYLGFNFEDAVIKAMGDANE